MVQKVHLHNSLIIFTFLCILLSCRENKKEIAQRVVADDSLSNFSTVSGDTLDKHNSQIHWENGFCYFKDSTYTGILKTYHLNGKMASLENFQKGLPHGWSYTFYSDGSSNEIRSYRKGKSYGKHIAYWPDGKTLRFEYHYVDDRHEGMQKKWYKTGKPYLFLHYQNDREEGLQQGWRENGKLFVNYIVKNGIAYGLQKSALCYPLEKEKVKLK